MASPGATLHAALEQPLAELGVDVESVEVQKAGRRHVVRIVVDREKERIAFHSASYWDISGVFATAADASFDAKLVALDGTRIAGSGDFDDRGGLKKKDVATLDEATASALAAALLGQTFEVRSVVQKPAQRQPKAPFTTSTLQQEASNRLRWGSQRTMRVAQSLYENGYITYMRTDSVTLSAQALNAARSQARASHQTAAAQGEVTQIA